MTDPITVLLVDDHALVRRGFRRLLEDDSGIKVVGEGSNGEEAIRLMTELKPQVIVMDAAMPGTGGLEATRKILAKFPKAAILMLSMHSEETLVRQALNAGARGYVLKNALELDLAAAVKRVAAGEQVIDPALVKPDPLPGERNRRLTPRELEVLQLISEGLVNREIGNRLFLSEETVKSHVRHLLAKLQARSRAHAVAVGFRRGLIA